MRQQNRNHSGSPRKRSGRRRGGQALVEASLVLLVFLAVLFSALDFGQVLFTHQLLVERVRAAVRWGIVNQWNDANSPDQIANVVLYNSPTAPETGSAFLGMTRGNVDVIHTAAPATDPNEERITVSIVNFQFYFFTPWLARTYTSNRGIVESAPVLWRP